MSKTLSRALSTAPARRAPGAPEAGRLRLPLSLKLSLAAILLAGIVALFAGLGGIWLSLQEARDTALREAAWLARDAAHRVAAARAEARPGPGDPARLLAALPAAGFGRERPAFLVDAAGRVVAHPDSAAVPVGRELPGLPALADGAARDGVQAGFGRNLAGESVAAGLAPVAGTPWRAVVELRTAEFHGPVWVAGLRALLLLLFAVLLALLGASLFARRLVASIQRLRRATDRVGGGDLAHRVTLRTGDELELLGNHLNQMSARLQDSQAGLQAKVAERTRELGLSLEQQTATSEVLETISRSTFDIDTVLRTLADTAARLCRTGPALIFRRDGDVYRYWVSQNLPDSYREAEEQAEIRPGRGSLVGRVALEKGAVHIVDVLADPEYEEKDVARLGGLRTILGVPLLSRGEPIGAFALARGEVEPFTDRQIKLLTTFADQAVIAIENARLFEEVQARTSDVAQSLQDLHAAQDRLVQSEKLASLGQLTAGIAHEIKNPLNFVNNFSALSIDLIDELRDVLAKEPLSDGARQDVEEIGEMLKGNLDKVVQHGKRADSIVKNMLLHSREGAGDLRPVDVNGLVEESLNLAYHGARAEQPKFNVTLEKSLDPAVGTADLYPQEITRVLLNLVTNGFYAVTKRRDEGRERGFEPKISVSTRDLGEEVEIRVRDNGLGIPEEIQAKIFNPFFTTKPAGEGTGLGLSLSHDIVTKQHGGTIEVNTEAGAYTEFVVRLPREGVPDVAEIPA